MRACLEKVDEERGEASVKENPKIQTPRRRRNHFINASFVREHGAGHSQDIAIRHMRPTWARGECDCPASLLPPSSTADKRKLSPRRARNFARNLPPGLEQRVTVLEKLIIFCTQAEEEAGEGRGWVDVSCSRFLVHWIMTFTVVLVVVELRCLRGKFTSFFYHSTPRNLLPLLLLFRCRHRSSTLWLLSQSYAGSLSCYTV